jgi:DNA-binding response OmpR family regulator
MQAYGFEVTVAATVTEALTSLDRQDIIVLDYDLADGKGTEVLQKIRNEQRASRVAMWTDSSACRTPGQTGPKPDAIFGKFELDALLFWIGKP